MSLNFQHPDYLWLLPAAVLIYMLWLRRRRPAYIAATTVTRARAILERPSLLRRLPWLLLAAGLVLITVALTGPRLPFAERAVVSRGLDIVIVLDLSASMQEVMEPEKTRQPRPLRDLTMKPAGRTRLAATKEAVRDFIARRRHDRIGLVVFSDHAYVVSPLTLDYDYLLHYLDQVDEQSLRGEGMTAIGDGIALATGLLDQQRQGEDRGRVITVFTDGKHNTGRDPLEVIPAADADGIRVHVVGVDLDRELKNDAKVRRLIDTVRGYGGGYFNADTQGELIRASTAIDDLEKGRLVSKTYVRNIPVYRWFALPALILILAALALRAIPFFADYT